MGRVNLSQLVEYEDALMIGVSSTVSHPTLRGDSKVSADG